MVDNWYDILINNPSRISEARMDLDDLMAKANKGGIVELMLKPQIQKIARLVGQLSEDYQMALDVQQSFDKKFQ